MVKTRGSAKRRRPQPVAKPRAVKAPDPVTPARTGRPPGEPRTEVGRWLRDHDEGITTFAERLDGLAKKHGILPSLLPVVGTLGDVVGGRHCPSPAVMLLIRIATGGSVDLEHWVAEIIARC